jgi:hypothetical protein
MRIIGNLKGDYYDGLQNSFFSQEPLYIRDKTEERLKEKDRIIEPENSSLIDRYSNRLTLDNSHGTIIGFCGKLYPVIRFDNKVQVNRINSNRQVYRTDHTVHTFCYNMDEVNAWAERFDVDLDRKRWNKTPRRNIERWFEFSSGLIKNCANIFSYHTPIFTLERVYYEILTRNPRLKDFEFYRVFDPYKTWQELEMFLSNQAAPEKPIPYIDDVTLAGAKGFDKFSFRKEKSRK